MTDAGIGHGMGMGMALALSLTATVMAHASKRKGNRFEREVVHEAEAVGLEAERAYASNGESLGEVEECDVLIRGRDDMVTDALRVQAKRRKSHAQYLHPPEGTDAVILREDREDALAIVPLDMLLDLLKNADDES